jgi:AraC family transcriptional regulator
MAHSAAWISNDVKAGDFFVADSGEPYELRWRTRSDQPFEVMHLHLGLPMLAALSRFDLSFGDFGGF